MFGITGKSDTGTTNSFMLLLQPRFDHQTKKTPNKASSARRAPLDKSYSLSYSTVSPKRESALTILTSKQ